MPLESLSYRHSLKLTSLPQRWLPLIHLYDPDLPLFPVYYIHTISSSTVNPNRPRLDERVYGYVERINAPPDGAFVVQLVLNKDLADPRNASFVAPVQRELEERLGLVDSVTIADVENAFTAPLDHANGMLTEMWRRVVTDAFGDKLPFGRLWDESLGLARFVASWYSEGGRKGELIQTHYFVSKFGVQIQSAGHIPQVDFYLLPTIRELCDRTNPLNDFPAFSKLVRVAEKFSDANGAEMEIDGVKLTRFVRPFSGGLSTPKLFAILKGAAIPIDLQPTAIECFNAFDKGPARTIIFLLMLNDLRKGLLTPKALTATQCGSIYESLANSYQSPKVIEIYAQQCFGNAAAMPIDTWMETFFRYPLNVWPQGKGVRRYEHIFRHSSDLGKVERLLWVASQARKVHSSACNDALWCVKYGAKPEKKGKPAVVRGANPMACNICLEAIRSVCPAFAVIRKSKVSFNGADPDADFQVVTSSGDNSPGQRLLSCKGKSVYGAVSDEFSSADDPDGFGSFPSSSHTGSSITVEQFIHDY